MEVEKQGRSSPGYQDTYESGEEWLNSRCILNVELTGFPDTTPYDHSEEWPLLILDQYGFLAHEELTDLADIVDMVIFLLCMHAARQVTIPRLSRDSYSTLDSYLCTWLLPYTVCYTG